MSFPITPPASTLPEDINAIAEAEAGIAQCLAVFLCDQLFPNLADVEPVEDQVELTKSVLCAYTCKEKAIGEIIEALANLTLADKGISPNGDSAEGCKCDC